jgi:hypothetical protein
MSDQDDKPRYNFSNNAGTSRVFVNDPLSSQPTPTVADSGAYRPAVVTAAPVSDEQPAAVRMLFAAFAALFVGFILVWLYAKFVFATKFSIAYLTAGIGWAIGFVVLIVSGRGGPIPALIGGSIAFVTLFFSRFLLLGDEVAARLPDMPNPLPLNDKTLGLTFQSFTWNPISFIILLVGVAGGFMVPLRAEEGPGGDE